MYYAQNLDMTFRISKTTRTYYFFVGKFIGNIIFKKLEPTLENTLIRTLCINIWSVMDKKTLIKRFSE